MAKTTWSLKLYPYYDEHPEAAPTEAAKAVGCSMGAASSARHRWKKARDYRIGTVRHPVRGLIKETPVEPVQEAPKEVPEIPKEAIQVQAIADELLKKAVEAIKSYNSILGERDFWRSQAYTAEAKAKEAEGENARILKIHNELVKRVNRVNSQL